MGHVHSIPELSHWSSNRGFSGSGDSTHACYFCRPGMYHPMPKGCTLCACCGVFIWTGSDDPMNEAMVVCEACGQDMGVA